MDNLVIFLRNCGLPQDIAEKIAKRLKTEVTSALEHVSPEDWDNLKDLTADEMKLFNEAIECYKKMKGLVQLHSQLRAMNA